MFYGRKRSDKAERNCLHLYACVAIFSRPVHHRQDAFLFNHRTMSLLNTLISQSLPYVPKAIVGRVSQRYIAGETLADAVRVVRSLNAKGFMATLDLLGEDITERASARAMRDDCIAMFECIKQERLNSNVSIKPSQLGLRIEDELCLTNVRDIVEAARVRNNFVRIDMEDSSTTSATLEMYRRLRGEGYDNVGVVIQAYLRRSEADVRSLVDMKANIRICKGIYIEPPDIAFQDRDEIRRSFVLLLQMMIEGGCYVGIATHDEYLVEKSFDLISQYKLQPHQYAFQMLLGVREQLRDDIRKRGHLLRIYVPYGREWYAYSLRRLKENPEIAGYIVKAMLTKGR